MYVYERTPYYDRTLKNTKYHYKYVGREVNGEARKIRSVLPRRSLICGPFIPIMRIVRDLGIEDILKLHLTEPETWHILALAISKVVRPLPQASISTWYEGTHLSVLMPASLTSQRNSDLMEKIGLSDLYRKFSHDLVERLHPGDSLLYDITSIPSYSSLDIFSLRNHRESTIRGILFVFFISLIIRSALLRGMESSGLLKKYSLERMILELERTKRQKDILEALEEISWW